MFYERSGHCFSFAMAIVVLGLSGCSQLGNWATNGHKVGPDYAAPAVFSANNWIDFNNPKVISQSHAVDDQQWWNVFADTQIPQIVAAANSQNLGAKEAMLRIQEQEFLRGVAVGNLFPQQQEFFADYQRIQNSDNGNQLGIADIGGNFDFFQLGFNASWEFDLFGRLRRTVEAADAQLHTAQEDERDIRLILTADAITAYTQVRVYQQRIRHALDQIDSQQETLLVVRSKFENGAVSKLDVTQAEANIETTRATIPDLKTGLRAANNRLCLLLGIPTRDLTLQWMAAPIPVSPESVALGLPRDLIRRRPDVRRAERELARQSALVGVATADLFPTFSLRGTINWQSFTFPELFESAANAGAIIPGVRWDILNYGRIKNRVKAQQSRFDQALVAYQQAVLRANTEVEDALTQFLNSQDRRSSLERVVASNRESIELAIKQYQVGTVEFDRVNDLRRELIEQLDRLTIAQGDVTVALIRLFRTMGGGWSAGHGAVECATDRRHLPRFSDLPSLDVESNTMPTLPSQTALTPVGAPVFDWQLGSPDHRNARPATDPNAVETLQGILSAERAPNTAASVNAQARDSGSPRQAARIRARGKQTRYPLH